MPTILSNRDMNKFASGQGMRMKHTGSMLRTNDANRDGNLSYPEGFCLFPHPASLLLVKISTDILPRHASQAKVNSLERGEEVLLA